MKEEPEREIVLRYSSRCRLCGDVLAEGQRALWSKNLGVRCVDSDSGEPECVSRYYTEDEHP